MTLIARLVLLFALAVTFGCGDGGTPCNELELALIDRKCPGCESESIEQCRADEEFQTCDQDERAINGGLVEDADACRASFEAFFVCIAQEPLTCDRVASNCLEAAGVYNLTCGGFGESLVCEPGFVTETDCNNLAALAECETTVFDPDDASCTLERCVFEPDATYQKCPCRIREVFTSEACDDLAAASGCAAPGYDETTEICTLQQCAIDPDPSDVRCQG